MINNRNNRDNNKNKRILAGAVVILALLIMLAAVFIVKGNKVHDASTSGDSAGVYADSAVPLATIFCASDYQIEEGWDTPAENLTAIMDSAINGLNDNRNSSDSGNDANAQDKSESGTIDSVIMCGDYTNDRKLHDYQLSAEESISEIREIAKSRISGLDDDNMIFVQGNHDALTESITASGLHEYDDYLVYVLNTENDFPWKQGKVAGSLNKVKASSEKLADCLSELKARGETRPVIIAGHVPLHFTARTSSRHTTGDNLYSSLIFNVVNDAAKDLDIVYLFGHNHSKGWDCYLGGGSIFMSPGDEILIPQFEETRINSDQYSKEPLNFTYLNAGYTGYYMNCGTDELDNGTWRDYDAADTALTGTTIEIYGDRIVYTRWDKDGVHNLNGKGEGDPYRGGIDAGLIPDDEYRTEQSSPQEVMRKQN